MSHSQLLLLVLLACSGTHTCILSAQRRLAGRSFFLRALLLNLIFSLLRSFAFVATLVFFKQPVTFSDTPRVNDLCGSFLQRRAFGPLRFAPSLNPQPLHRPPVSWNRHAYITHTCKLTHTHTHTNQNALRENQHAFMLICDLTASSKSERHCLSRHSNMNYFVPDSPLPETRRCVCGVFSRTALYTQVSQNKMDWNSGKISP